MPSVMVTAGCGEHGTNGAVMPLTFRRGPCSSNASTRVTLISSSAVMMDFTAAGSPPFNANASIGVLQTAPLVFTGFFSSSPKISAVIASKRHKTKEIFMGNSSSIEGYATRERYTDTFLHFISRIQQFETSPK